MKQEVLIEIAGMCALLAAAITGYLLYKERAAGQLLRRLNMLVRSQKNEPKQGRLSMFYDLLERFQKQRRRWRIGLEEEEALQGRLVSGGFRGSRAVEVYFALRTMVPMLMILLAGCLPRHRSFWMASLAGLAYLAPDLTLRRVVRGRRKRIALGLPDALDLMVICVEAGLGIDQALLRVSQELGTMHPELSEEFVLINLEQRAGKARLQAWQNMAERVGLEEMTSFAGMLVQTERFGTPIAKALREFAATMRERRTQLVEELAAKLPVKIIFPLAIFIFPSIFIVLLGPAALALMDNLTGVAK